MKNRRKAKNRTLSDLERWRNLCDALSEDALHAEYVQTPKPPASEIERPTTMQDAIHQALDAADEAILENPLLAGTPAYMLAQQRAFLRSLEKLDKGKNVEPAKEPSTPKEGAITNAPKKNGS